MEDEIVEETMDVFEPNPPKEGMEYVYSLDLAWPIYSADDERPTYMHNSVWDKGEPKEFEVNSQEELDSLKERPYSIKVKEGIIVTDVVQREQGDYEFTIKDNGIRCRCTYNWAFWENTPKNIKRIEKYRKESAKLKKLKKAVNRLRDDIDQIR